MYHVELRQFPQNVCRFNMDERLLRTIVEPWVQGDEFEFGEQLWDPYKAKLTILDGPQIPLGQLTMGRGWGVAQRQGTDVTERMLASARHALAAAPERAPAQPLGDGLPQPGSGLAAAATTPPVAAGASAGDAFALGVQMAALLGPDAVRLLDAWRATAASSPGLAPSETLALAERALRDADAQA